MQRTCKVCKVIGEYKPTEKSAKARGFHGYVCWACHMEEQRAWRLTPVGRQEANEASAAYRRRRNAEADTAAERESAGHDCARRV